MNVYTFIYLNDPGYGFEKTVPMRFQLMNATGALDVYLLPDYATFLNAKSLTASDFQARQFPFVRRFDSVKTLKDAVNASVGMGVMVINGGVKTVDFLISSELVD